MEHHIYDQQFFANTNKLETASAPALAHIIAKHFTFQSVIDIGCGIGIYLREFEKLGKEVIGYDGAAAAIEDSLIGNKIQLHDLTTPLMLDREFDLCLCLEVAEHLPATAAPTLINTLTVLAPTIIFSAAIPGQGDAAIGHINEQPHEYWIKLFVERGYQFQQDLSLTIREELRQADIVWWLVQNLMVFKK